MVPASGDRGIVLLVDDSPESLRMLIDALEGAGFTALVARNGEAALRLLDRVEPDVILLDAVMPGIDGFDLCARIKERDRFAATPVLFMTGLDESGHVRRGLEAGGVDYVVKPTHPDELIARITRHAANARLISDARNALDASGAAVIALDEAVRVVWQSERARHLLTDFLGSSADETLSTCEAFTSWLEGARQTPLSEVPHLRLAFGKRDAHLEVTYAGRAASGSSLCRLSVEDEGAPQEKLARAFHLSSREGEVLLWLARGKSNRDIAEILGLSPRTVTKHVEQVLKKLKVENRTSAAVMALKQCDI